MEGNKKIAINTVFLYTKFIITTILSLLISRLVLQALGESDYGLYAVVGGIVAMLNTLGATMTSTSYRYISVEIGKGKDGNINKIYNTILVVHIAFALTLVLLGETIGVFYINNYLNIDPAKLSDALFILHLSLLTTAFSVISFPMNGLIMAREKFLFTSVVEIINALLKTVFVFVLIYYEGNKLRFYAIALAIIQFTTPLIYQIYCRIKEPKVVKWNFNKNLDDYKQLFSFTFWIFLGAIALIGKIQGCVLIINFFFGTILNAAYGLATQVNHAVINFTSTLRQAAIPQIMKSHGNGDENRSLSLVYYISKYSFLSMNIVAIPIIININYILHLWLDKAPEYTNIFICLMLVDGMISNLGAGFDACIQATGNIRKNQIGYSIINLTILPLIYILYKIGLPPYINVICMIIITISVLVFQINIMKELTSFSIKKYLNNTLKPALSSALLAIVPLFLIKTFVDKTQIINIIFIFISFIWTCISIYLCGITRKEKEMLTTVLKKIINKVL